MRAARPRLFCRHRKKRFDQVRVKGCCQADGLRKARRIDGGVTVQAFFMEDYRDTEATFLDKEFLNVVGQFRIRAGFESAAGVTGTPHLTEPKTCFETRARFA